MLGKWLCRKNLLTQVDIAEKELERGNIVAGFRVGKRAWDTFNSAADIGAVVEPELTQIFTRLKALEKKHCEGPLAAAKMAVNTVVMFYAEHGERMGRTIPDIESEFLREVLRNPPPPFLNEAELSEYRAAVAEEVRRVHSMKRK